LRISRIAMISRISTMKPRTPPPLPHFQALLWVLTDPSAAARAKRRDCTRRVLRVVVEKYIFACFVCLLVSL